MGGLSNSLRKTGDAVRSLSLQGRQWKPIHFDNYTLNLDIRLAANEQLRENHWRRERGSQGNEEAGGTTVTKSSPPDTCGHRWLAERGRQAGPSHTGAQRPAPVALVHHPAFSLISHSLFSQQIRSGAYFLPATAQAQAAQQWRTRTKALLTSGRERGRQREGNGKPADRNASNTELGARSRRQSTAGSRWIRLGRARGRLRRGTSVWAETQRVERVGTGVWAVITSAM